MKHKAFFNRIINALALISFCFMISTGMILKWILPPGSGRAEKLLTGGGRREKTIELFWGLSRHEWGDLHFYISLSFLTFLIFHLFLHWSWIRATAWGTAQCPQPWHRKAATAVILLLVAGSVLFPWMFQPETLTASEYLKRF